MRIGDFSDQVPQIAVSYFSKTALAAAGIAFPGVGILVGMLIGRLMQDSSALHRAQTRAHFSNKVLRPIFDAAKSNDPGEYAAAAPLLQNPVTGPEHFGYLYEGGLAPPVQVPDPLRDDGGTRQVNIDLNSRWAPAAYIVVIGNALASRSYAGALAFARIVDQSTDGARRQWDDQESARQVEIDKLNPPRQDD